MTMTIDISPQEEARLKEEAARRGQAADEYIRESFQTWLSLTTPETEEDAFQSERALSLPTLEELWINEHNAIYDTL